MKYKIWLFTLTSIVICGLIFWLSNQQGDISYEISGAVTKFTADITHMPENDANDSFPFIYTLEFIYRKCAHIILYFLLGISLNLLLTAIYQIKKIDSKHIRYLSITMFGLLYAITDEIHQYFVPGRTSSVFDILYDMIGFLIAIVLSELIKKRKRI